MSSFVLSSFILLSLVCYLQCSYVSLSTGTIDPIFAKSAVKRQASERTINQSVE